MSTFGRAVGAAPASPYRALDAELAAIAGDPACPMASLSVLAIRKGKVVYQRQIGPRQQGGEPVNAATLFRIASISKMVTTIGAMLLVEQGKLFLDADASEMLGFSLRNPYFPERPVTLRHLLSHTSTLRDTAGYSWPCATRLADVFKGSVMWDDAARPGEFFTYSNLNWGVVGTMMERATGERFDRLMKRLVLAPLGMQGGYNPSEFSTAEQASLATLYRKRTVDTEVWDENGPWVAQVDAQIKRPEGVDSYVVGSNATPFSPTGGLRVSPAGLGKLMLMLMNGGRHGGKVFMQPDTLAAMLARQWTTNGKNGDTENGKFRAWGLGNQHFGDMVQGGGFDAIGHLGDAYGLYSVFMADLKRKSGIIAFVGGTGTDPELYKGLSSPLVRFQEQLISALYRKAIV